LDVVYPGIWPDNGTVPPTLLLLVLVLVLVLVLIVHELLLLVVLLVRGLAPLVSATTSTWLRQLQLLKEESPVEPHVPGCSVPTFVRAFPFHDHTKAVNAAATAATSAAAAAAAAAAAPVGTSTVNLASGGGGLLRRWGCHALVLVDEVNPRVTAATERAPHSIRLLEDGMITIPTEGAPLVRRRIVMDITSMITSISISSGTLLASAGGNMVLHVDAHYGRAAPLAGDAPE
jgi:hypothetical protein